MASITNTSVTPLPLSSTCTPAKRRQNAKASVRIDVVRSDEKFSLTDEEMALIVDFRRMGKSSRAMMPSFFAMCVECDQREEHRTRPWLQLVRGAA